MRLALLLLILRCITSNDAPSVEWKGIRVGSRVSRGEGWAYGEQDGGAGRQGTVLELRPWRREQEGGGYAAGLLAARVKWDATGEVNAYRWDAPGSGVRDLQLEGWRPLSVEEAALPPSYAAAAEAEGRQARSSAALVASLRGLWAGLGGAGWASQRGWREAFGGALGSSSASALPALLPCGGASSRSGWEGLACTLDHAGLLGLDLSQNGLAGQLTGDMLVALPAGLRSLSLARNALHGALPSALCRFRELRFLDLSFNRFTGPLPECLGELAALEVLHLANNALSGRVPPLWARLENLQSLHLQGNGGLEPPLSQPLQQRLRALQHLGLPPQLRGG